MRRFNLIFRLKRLIWSGIWEVNYTEAIEHNLSFPKISCPEISFPTVTGLGETC